MLKNVLRPKRGRLKKGLVFLVIVSILVLLVVQYENYYGLSLDNKRLEISKCPACLGEDICSSFFQNKIKLKKPSVFLKYFFNAKNVYEGQFESHEPRDVMLKKLGSDEEWRDFDKKVCEFYHRSEKCSPATAIRHLASLWMNTNGILNLSVLKDHLPESSETFTCDSSSSNLMAFLQSRASRQKPEHFLTSVMINPEPIIAMAFPSSEGWPFPKYYGSCGRFSVFENAGQPLANFLEADWTLRARFALQILELAQKMSDNAVLSLYLTDWSLDNFAVEIQKFQVKLIDLENIILVNKTEVERVKAPGFDIDHHSTAFGCEHKCFSYFAPDLCSHMKVSISSSISLSFFI